MNAPPDWWKHFFSGLAVSFWRAALPPEATKADVDYLWKHLRLSPGDRVLDVPCGAGRLTLPLAERGCAMTGIDISLDFLEAAREVAAEKRLNVELVEADMRAVPTHGGFDAAFCFGNSFGYLDDSGNLEFIEAVAAALKPGGRFALDFGQTAEGVYPRLELRQAGEMAGFRFVEETRLDPATSRIENVFEFSKDGKTERKLASQRIYLAGDVIRMLAAAGLETREMFGSIEGESFGLSSQRLLVVAEKSGVSGAKRG